MMLAGLKERKGGKERKTPTLTLTPTLTSTTTCTSTTTTPGIEKRQAGRILSRFAWQNFQRALINQHVEMLRQGETERSHPGSYTPLPAGLWTGRGQASI